MLKTLFDIFDFFRFLLDLHAYWFRHRGYKSGRCYSGMVPNNTPDTKWHETSSYYCCRFCTSKYMSSFTLVFVFLYISVQFFDCYATSHSNDESHLDFLLRLDITSSSIWWVDTIPQNLERSTSVSLLLLPDGQCYHFRTVVRVHLILFHLPLCSLTGEIILVCMDGLHSAT